MVRFLKTPARQRFCLWLLVAFGLVIGLAAAAPQNFLEEGQKAFDKGAFATAAGHWQKALEVAHQSKDSHAQIVSSVWLASACQALGQQRRAVQLLQEAVDLAQKTGDSAVIAWTKSRLGAAFILTHEYEAAASSLEEALVAARARQDSGLTVAILNDQGNLLAVQNKYPEALAAFTDSVAIARQVRDIASTAGALCNAAAMAARIKDEAKAAEFNAEALAEIQQLATSHEKAFLLLRAGQTARQLNPTDSDARPRFRRGAASAFEQAQRIGEQLHDGAVQTYALGFLGELSEDDNQLDAALESTRRASFTAQQAHLPEALYRWQWRIGRLLKRRGEADLAMAAYRRAIQTLQPIRNDFSVGYGNAVVHATFREENGPLYFELADLLLQQAKEVRDPAAAQNLLLEARDTVEQLKAVELEDYFRDDCVNVQRARQRSLETVDAHTAVVYLIPLATRTEMLVGITSGLSRFTLEVTSEALTREVAQFRRNLETRTTYGYLAQAQQLYDWLIRPIRALLTENHIDTLVFVPDGALRTIPLGSLHDGERFLVQDFAIGVAPGLSLVEPRPIRREKVHLLLNGLSKPVQGYPALSFVPGELQSVEGSYRGDILLNERFTLQELQRKLTDEQYSVIHIASHGQFDRDVRKTFLLTYDGKLTLNRLEALIRPSQYRGRPVELLVLSACQTAAGDEQAALGLAGIAVKAGARSALATLWFVNDQSTSLLISELYGQLRHAPSLSKAQALQRAQVKLLSDRRYRHPCYWAPYLIIGNWL